MVTGTHLSRGCPETSARNYRYYLLNNPEERSYLDLHKLKSSNKDAAGGVGVALAADDSDDSRGTELRGSRVYEFCSEMFDLFLRLEETAGLE